MLLHMCAPLPCVTPEQTRLYLFVCLLPVQVMKAHTQVAMSAKPAMCSTHSKDLSHFCTSCVTPVCGECVNGQHSTHSTEKLETAVRANKHAVSVVADELVAHQVAIKQCMEEVARLISGT